MENLYKKTNFGNNPPLEVPSEVYDECAKVSDAMYDRHRLISHGFIPVVLPNGTKLERLVGDVELCASDSPEVRAVVSSEFQERLRNGLLNQQRSPSRDGRVTDDELADSVIPSSLEPDEAAEYIKSVIGTSPSGTPIADTPPVDTPPADTSPAE